MRFGAISLDMKLGDHEAGTLQGNAGISIGPESADVVTLEHTPTSVARIAIADALGRNGGIGYSLEGTLRAAPEDSGERSFDIERTSGLNPVPGLPGGRSEEHTSELQSLMRISYADCCLQKKNTHKRTK